jgi:excisionase family DNA binding protein
MAMLTTTEFAQQVGLTRARINQMLSDEEIEGEKLGRDWMIDEKYVEVVKSRPERRGRKRKTKGNGRAEVRR